MLNSASQKKRLAYGIIIIPAFCISTSAVAIEIML
jgi:hypothetical protein